MKLINLLLLFLPVLGYSQVRENTLTLGDPDSVITGEHYPTLTRGTVWFESRYSTEIKKGAVKTPVQVMDSGIKVEVFETRDTIYNCPGDNTLFFQYDYNVSSKRDVSNCTLDKIVTCRTYRFYIINEEGKKEYLELDINKNK